MTSGIRLSGLRFALGAAVLLAVAFDLQDPVSTGGSREPLVLTYLANEGFLVEVGEQAVLVDAFIGKPYAGYPALPEGVLARLRAASGRFDGVELALTSHVHADHFQASVARAFLDASPETLFVSSPQVVAELTGGGWEGERVEERFPEAGAALALEHAGIEVGFARIRHSGGMADVQNLGNLFVIGGHRVVHLGDADMDPKLFASYATFLRDVDVALVPYWFFVSGTGRAILKEYLPAKAHVAMHFPSKKLAQEVAAVVAANKKVHAYTEALQSERFE